MDQKENITYEDLKRACSEGVPVSFRNSIGDKYTTVAIKLDEGTVEARDARGNVAWGLASESLGVWDDNEDLVIHWPEGYKPKRKKARIERSVMVSIGEECYDENGIDCEPIDSVRETLAATVKARDVTNKENADMRRKIRRWESENDRHGWTV